MKLKFYFLIGLVFIFTGLAVFLFMDDSEPDHFSQLPSGVSDARAYILPLSQPNLLPILDSSIARPQIIAKSFIVFDVKSGKTLWDKSKSLKLPVASLTKVLSAMVILENSSQEDVVTVPKEALRVDNEKQTLYLNEQITVENLLKLMLIESSNDAAYALDYYIQNTRNIDFVQKMNEKALSLGMYNSYFLDPAGLDDNAFSTVEDLVKLVQYSLKYEKIWQFLAQEEAAVSSADGKIVHTVKNTNQLLGVIPNIIGGKTGNTNKALGCLILIVKLPETSDILISVVLGSEDRFGDTAKIMDWTKSAYRWK